MFDTKEKTMTCQNGNKRRQAALVIWAKQRKITEYDWYELAYQIENSYDNVIDNRFKRIFDNICMLFSEKTTYNDILTILKNNFNDVEETKNFIENNGNVKENVYTNDNIKKEGNLININNASPEQLAELPGINIVIAKKIVQRVNLKGDYNSIEQMYKEMKIKKHFQKHLNHLICVEIALKKENLKKNEERIIDL